MLSLLDPRDDGIGRAAEDDGHAWAVTGLWAAAVHDDPDACPPATVPGIETRVNIGHRDQVAQAQPGRPVSGSRGGGELEVQVPHRRRPADPVADELARDD